MKIDETYFSGHDTDDSAEDFDQNNSISYPVYVGTVVTDLNLKKVSSSEKNLKYYYGIAKSIQSMVATTRVVETVSEPLCFVDDEELPGQDCFIETFGELPVLSRNGWHGWSSFDFGCGFSMGKRTSKTAVVSLIKNIIVYISRKRDIVNSNNPMRIVFFVEGPVQIINIFDTTELVTNGDLEVIATQSAYRLMTSLNSNQEPELFSDYVKAVTKGNDKKYLSFFEKAIYNVESAAELYVGCLRIKNITSSKYLDELIELADYKPFMVNTVEVPLFEVTAKDNIYNLSELKNYTDCEDFILTFTTYKNLYTSLIFIPMSGKISEYVEDYTPAWEEMTFLFCKIGNFMLSNSEFYECTAKMLLEFGITYDDMFHIQVQYETECLNSEAYRVHFFREVCGYMKKIITTNP